MASAKKDQCGCCTERFSQWTTLFGFIIYFFLYLVLCSFISLKFDTADVITGAVVVIATCVHVVTSVIVTI